MATLSYLAGGIGVLLGIIVAISANHHRDFALWIGFFAALFVLFSGFAGYQQILWNADDIAAGRGPATKADLKAFVFEVEHSTPRQELVGTQSPSAEGADTIGSGPQTTANAASSGQSGGTTANVVSNNPAPPPQNMTATSTNQSGGITANVVNLGPQPRKLTDAQKAIITDALKPFAANTKLRIFCTATDTEAANFSKQIVDAVQASGIKADISWGQAFGDGPLLGVEVAVRDGHSPPPLAVALGNALVRAGVAVHGSQYPQWPDTMKDNVGLSVYLNPNNR